MAATAARVFVEMPKLVGILTLGPAAFLGSVQAAKLYRNATSSPEENTGHMAGAVRKASVAHRLTDGATPHLKHVDAKYLEKTLKRNSALREHAAEIQASRNSLLGRTA